MHHPRRPSRSAALTTAALLPLLALLATLLVTARPTAPASEQITNSAAATSDHRAVGPHAADACDTACTLSTATRHTQHGEHPTPRNHLTPALADDTLLSPARPALHRSTTQRIPSPEPIPTPDRDRAPPASSGT